MKITQKINKTKIWFFEKFSKIDKLSAKVTKEKEWKIQFTNILSEIMDITIGAQSLQG